MARYARDDHQSANADFVAKKGAAIVLNETELPDLFEAVSTLFSEGERLSKIRQQLDHMDEPDEVSSLADALEDLITNQIQESNSNPVSSRST